MNKETRQNGQSHLDREYGAVPSWTNAGAAWPADYIDEARAAGFSEEHAQAFLAVLFDIMSRFVEMGFSSDACAYVVQSVLHGSQDDSGLGYDSFLIDDDGKE